MLPDAVATPASESRTLTASGGATGPTLVGSATISTSESATGFEGATTTGSENPVVATPEDSATTSTAEDTRSLPTVATPDSEEAANY